MTSEESTTHLGDWLKAAHYRCSRTRSLFGNVLNQNARRQPRTSWNFLEDH